MTDTISQTELELTSERRKVKDEEWEKEQDNLTGSNPTFGASTFA